MAGKPGSNGCALWYQSIKTALKLRRDTHHEMENLRAAVRKIPSLR
jgi:hypothetical protein